MPRKFLNLRACLPRAHRPTARAQAHVQVQRLTTPQIKARARQPLARYHELGKLRAVGHQLWCVVTDARSHWLGVLVFRAAARCWRARDRGIGWSEEHRPRRLPLVVNHCRFLLLPEKTFPKLGSAPCAWRWSD